MDGFGVQQTGKGWLFELLLRKKRLIPVSTGFGLDSLSSGAALSRLQNSLRRSSRFFLSSSSLSCSLLAFLRLIESEGTRSSALLLAELPLPAVASPPSLGRCSFTPFTLPVSVFSSSFPFPFSFSFSFSISFFIFIFIACILLNSPVFRTDVGLIFVVTLSPRTIAPFLSTSRLSPPPISIPRARGGSEYPCWLASKNRSISLRSPSTTHSSLAWQRQDCMGR